MRWQAFRQISTGELTNAIFTTAGDYDSFDPGITESRRLDIALAVGIPESDLEVIEQARKPGQFRQTIVLPVNTGPSRAELYATADQAGKLDMVAREIGLIEDAV